MGRGNNLKRPINQERSSSWGFNREWGSTDDWGGMGENPGADGQVSKRKFRIWDGRGRKGTSQTLLTVQ